MEPRTDELTAFKTQINLTQAAAAWGYQIDARASCRSSVKMRHPAGDIIVVGKDGETWVYFSVSGDHGGTVVDLAQRVFAENLGHVRKRLRPWLAGGAPSLPPTAYVERVEPVPRDLLAVRAAYEAAERVEGFHTYLCEGRAIPPTLVASSSISGRIRTDARGNALFPHFDGEGELVGFEVKNQGFTGFSSGGRKGLWGSRKNEGDRELVIAETAVDALSYAALRGIEGRRLVSTAGRMSPQQPLLLLSTIKDLPQGGRVVLAFDNDEGGDELTRELTELFAEAQRIDLALIEDRPPERGSDWNDALRASTPPPPSPTVR